ncbi:MULTISPECIES: hypothetical protein [unclassified Streptomyces]|uniref:hypothetical protein n=1 Tax=unclassified Streptomyces TaxID=2593676 RepID=UPI00300A7B97
MTAWLQMLELVHPRHVLAALRIADLTLSLLRQQQVDAQRVTGIPREMPLIRPISCPDMRYLANRRP